MDDRPISGQASGPDERTKFPVPQADGVRPRHRPGDALVSNTEPGRSELRRCGRSDLCGYRILGGLWQQPSRWQVLAGEPPRPAHGPPGGIEADLCLSDLTGVTRVAPEDAGQPFRIRRSEVSPVRRRIPGGQGARLETRRRLGAMRPEKLTGRRGSALASTSSRSLTCCSTAAVFASAAPCWARRCASLAAFSRSLASLACSFAWRSASRRCAAMRRSHSERPPPPSTAVTLRSPSATASSPRRLPRSGPSGQEQVMNARCPQPQPARRNTCLAGRETPASRRLLGHASVMRPGRTLWLRRNTLPGSYRCLTAARR